MALVKCAECKNLVSNKVLTCRYCGYSPRGYCKSCKYYQTDYPSTRGRCKMTEDDYVSEDKSVCSAERKRFPF